MAKINITQRVNADPNLFDLLRRIAYQLNLLSEGAISAKYNALAAPPTSGKWARGDWVENSAPSELGATGAKYVVQGWRCTVSGEPGTWMAARTLTGN